MFNNLLVGYEIQSIGIYVFLYLSVN